MRIKIYQINVSKDKSRVMFRNLNETRRITGKEDVIRSIYDMVFEGEVDCGTLEDVFQMFNMYSPENFAGRSMSVSDIVEVESKLYFCDSFGFKEVKWEEQNKSGRRCKCGCNRFYAHQVVHMDVIVDADGMFLDNIPDGIESAIYEAGTPFGPFQCVECGAEYDEITELRNS